MIAQITNAAVAVTSRIDWQILGSNVFMFAVGAVMAYNTWRLSRTNKTVNTIHTLTNSQMGLQKKSLAEVTAAKAAITKNELDIAEAVKARDDYMDHMSKQAKADAEIRGGM